MAATKTASKTFKITNEQDCDGSINNFLNNNPNSFIVSLHFWAKEVNNYVTIYYINHN